MTSFSSGETDQVVGFDVEVDDGAAVEEGEPGEQLSAPGAASLLSQTVGGRTDPLDKAG